MTGDPISRKGRHGVRDLFGGADPGVHDSGDSLALPRRSGRVLVCTPQPA